MPNSLERAFAVLELVDQIPGGLTNHDICRRLNIPTSTCSYITKRLECRGYLLRDEHTRRFKVGLSVVALAHGALRELGFRSVSEPVLYKVARDTGLSVGLGVLERGRVLIVDRVESPQLLQDAVNAPQERTFGRTGGSVVRTRDQRDAGRELPAHATALGKVLLAHLLPDDLTDFLHHAVLTRATGRTIVSKPILLKELDTVRKQGYATAEEELYPGVWGLAVAIAGELDTPLAAISLNGSMSSPAWDDRRMLLRRIEEAARIIATRTARR